MNHIEQFRDAIRAAGMTPPEEISDDGKLHRFAPSGKKHDDAGWYVLHGDGVPAGVFGDWRTGLSTNWRADIGRQLTPAEENAHRERIKAAQAVRKVADARRRAEAATKGKALWESAQSASADHPYLARKGVAPVDTLREIPQERAAAILGYSPWAEGEVLCGRILVAPVKIDGALSTCEMIDEAGRKSAIAGGAKLGGYWCAQPLPEGDGTGVTLLIGEGVATVLSAQSATGYAGIAALTSSNLRTVATTMRARHPSATIVLLGELEKATGLPERHAAEAAQAVGGKVAMPDFGDKRPDGATDFNDLAQHRGAEAVERAIRDAIAAEASEQQPEGDNATGCDPNAYDVALIRGDSIAPQAVQWIWGGWLAAGKFHVLAGQPGVGKSTIALGLAATITQGGRWPDGTGAPVGNVLTWSGEDDPADTIVPRLMAMGADMSRVYFVGDVRDGAGRVAFDPSRHLSALELEAARIGGVKLVIVDPIVSAVAGDSHKNAEVRRSLQPLVDLATKLDCAVLGVSHFTKGTAGRDPVERVTGSLAFGALARIVIVAAKLPENDSGKAGRLLARAKSNIGPDGGGFAYDIEQVPIPSVAELFGSCVLWGDVIDGTARELLAEAEATGDEPHVEREKAAGWLRECLAHGPVSSRQIKVDCDGAGFSWRTIQRAQKALGIVAKKEGMKGGWIWRLPDPDSPKNANIAEERQQNSLAAFGQVGALRGDDDAVEVEF